jgi:molybdate transport system substrate-binding protein
VLDVIIAKAIRLAAAIRRHEQPAAIKSLRVVGVVLAVLAVITAIPGCNGPGSSEQETTPTNRGEPKAQAELNVSAAMSLKDALQKLASDFEEQNKAKIILNFASSSDLQAQIEQGAPVDIFISAGKKQMDTLEKKGLIKASSRLNLLGNELVIIIPATSKQPIHTIKDLAPAKSKDIGKIAIGMPETVPAGKYAKETLEKAGIWDVVRPSLVMAKDVRQIIGYVEMGNAGAGFVYKSDMKAPGKARVAVAVPNNYHSPIVYPIAIIKDAKQPELAAKFIEYLKSAKSSAAFKEFGFKPLGR